MSKNYYHKQAGYDKSKTGDNTHSPRCNVTQVPSTRANGSLSPSPQHPCPAPLRPHPPPALPGDHLHPIKLSHCGQAALVRGGTGVTEC